MSRINFGAAATIECSDQPLDISFHPTKSTLVAAALVDGTLEVHDFTELLSSPTTATAKNDDEDEEEEETIVSSTQVHIQPLLQSMGNEPQYASCRAVRFSSDGSTIWTGGSEGNVVALDATRICTFSMPTSQQQKETFRYRISDAGYQSKAPIQKIYELPERNFFVTGDDAGCVRIWDPRLVNTTATSNGNVHHQMSRGNPPRGCVADWKVHDDYISGLQHNDTDANEGHTLLASSADGTLSVYDIRMSSHAATTALQSNQSTKEQRLPPGVIRRSDPQDDELLSLCILKHGTKVVCGTTEGVLAIFSYGTWGDVSDRFPGHPSSIDAILKVDEDTILTGSSDGFIRVVSIHPDKLIGVLGDNHEGFPIEQLQFTCDKSFVGSVTHDNYVRLWDARILDENYDDDACDDGCHADLNIAAVSSTNATKTNIDNEWEDMDEDDDDNSGDDDDDDSGSDEEMQENAKPRRVSKNDKRASRLKSENERFFDDI
jgi:WD repeat-containing protein 55